MSDFDSIAIDKKDRVPAVKLQTGFYDVKNVVRTFFCGRKREKRGTLFADTAESLVSTIETQRNTELVAIAENLLRQQRMTENTHARRRLERWATRLITWYLIIVLLLIVADGVVRVCLDKTFMPTEIMIAILTTTAVNILGLGYIVLKGHFEVKDKD